MDLNDLMKQADDKYKNGGEAKTANKPADDAQQDDEPVATTDTPSQPEPAEVADEAVATEA